MSLQAVLEERFLLPLSPNNQVRTSNRSQGHDPISHSNPSSHLAELSLTDILTPANLTPLFTSHPDLVQTLFPHLPPDLPVPPSADVLQQVIASPQFRAAVRNVDMALRTGLLGGLVRSLGLPEEAGSGIEAFLRAIQEQANREGGGTSESMDTD